MHFNHISLLILLIIPTLVLVQQADNAQNIEEAGDALIDLSEADFDSRVTSNENERWFVMFYAPWCPHCRNAMPAFNDLAKSLKGKVNVARADCTVNPGLLGKFSIQGFPTFLYFYKGQIHQYEGERTVQAWTDFVNKDYKETDIKEPEEEKTVEDEATPLNPEEDLAQNRQNQEGEERADSLIELVDDDFDGQVLSKDDERWFIMFYVPWCPHCQHAMPIFNDLANSLQGQLKFGRVNCDDNSALRDKYSIQGYPTFLYFYKGEIRQYEGERTVEAWTNFVNKDYKKVETTDPEEEKVVEVNSTPLSAEENSPQENPAPQNLEEKGDNLIELFAADFDNGALPRDDERWFVMFFAPWCPHCRDAMSEFNELADALKGEVKVGRIDCDANPGVRDRYSIQGYPTFLYFYKGEIRQYEGDRTVKAWTDFINKDYKKAETTEPEEEKVVEDNSTPLNTEENPSKENQEPEKTEEKNDALIELTLDNFDSQVLANDDERWFVMFYAPDCPHCETAMPIFSKLAETLKDHVKVGRVNCDTNPELTDRYSIQAHPTFLYFHKGEVRQYEGERAIKTWTDFVDSDYTATETLTPDQNKVVEENTTPLQPQEDQPIENRPSLVPGYRPDELDIESSQEGQSVEKNPLPVPGHKPEETMEKDVETYIPQENPAIDAKYSDAPERNRNETQVSQENNITKESGNHIPLQNQMTQNNSLYDPTKDENRGNRTIDTRGSEQNESYAENINSTVPAQKESFAENANPIPLEQNLSTTQKSPQAPDYNQERDQNLANRENKTLYARKRDQDGSLAYPMPPTQNESSVENVNLTVPAQNESFVENANPIPPEQNLSTTQRSPQAPDYNQERDQNLANRENKTLDARRPQLNESIPQITAPSAPIPVNTHLRPEYPENAVNETKPQQNNTIEENTNTRPPQQAPIDYNMEREQNMVNNENRTINDTRPQQNEFMAENVPTQPSQENLPPQENPVREERYPETPDDKRTESNVTERNKTIEQNTQPLLPQENPVLAERYSENLENNRTDGRRPEENNPIEENTNPPPPPPQDPTIEKRSPEIPNYNPERDQNLLNERNNNISTGRPEQHQPPIAQNITSAPSSNQTPNTSASHENKKTVPPSQPPVPERYPETTANKPNVITENANPLNPSAGSGSLIDLTQNNFDNEVFAQEDSRWMIMFYAPWCPHCKHAMPTFTELAKSLKGIAHVGRVDCDANPQLRQRFNIRGYPTFLYFHQGEVRIFEGARTVEAWTEFVKEGYKKIEAVEENVRGIKRVEGDDTATRGNKFFGITTETLIIAATIIGTMLLFCYFAVSHRKHGEEDITVQHAQLDESNAVEEDTRIPID